MATDYDALVLRAETAANNAAASAEQAAADRQAVEQLTLTINNEQAVSIQNSKEEIRQAIVAKGQECDTSVAFADYADKILSITTEAGGVDTSNDTVTADSMLLGVTAHNAAGVQITGTIATSTPTIDDNLITIPAGHIASDTTLTVDEAATATVSDGTVTINKGYTSKEYVVSVATAGAVVTDRNVVTVPKGWHDGSTVTLVSRSLPNISIAVDPDSGRVTASYTAEEGWHNAGTIDAAETLDVQAAQTYTPGTADITIPAYKFLTGAQTIKGEPNLIAENIPSDMNFFGIQGTREIGATGEGGSCKFYECATSTETEGTPEVKAGITVSGVTNPESCNGHYTLDGEFTTYEEALWKNDSSDMKFYKSRAVDYWVISQIVEDYPDSAYFFADFRTADGSVIPPWEAVNWTAIGEGTPLVTGSLEDIPAVSGEKVWTGYEWNLVEKEIASEPVFDYSFILFGGPDAKAFSGEYKPTDATKDKTGTEVVYTAGDNKFCFCNPALGYWVLSTDGSAASEFRTSSDSLTNPWDAGRSGWYNQESGNINSKIYAQTPAAVTGYIVSANENSTLPSSTYDYGMYTDSGETSDGVPVYTNDVGQKLYRITFESYGTYWCVFNTVTTPNNMESTYTYVESTSDTPPDTIGAVTVQPYTAPEASDPEVIKVYEKSTTLTEGLSWTSVKPKVGKSYTEDALVEAKLYEGYSIPADFIYHWSMSSASEFSEASISGAVVFGVENDRPVAKFDGNSQINYTSLSELPQGNAAHSIALWVRSTTPCNSESPECLIGWGSTPYSATATALSWEFEGTSAFTNWRDFLLTSPVLTDGSWHHLAGTFDGTTAKLYVDGEQLSSAEATFAIGGTQFGIGGCFWMSSNKFTGDLSDIYIFNRAITDKDVKGLYYVFEDVPEPEQPSNPETPDTPETGDGGSTETESDVLIVSGAYGQGNDIDGEYTLKEPTATGTNRVWTNGTYDIFYVSNGDDGFPSWRIAPASAHQSYDYYIYNSPENITNDDGSSRTWNYQSSTCSLKVTKKK